MVTSGKERKPSQDDRYIKRWVARKLPVGDEGELAVRFSSDQAMELWLQEKEAQAAKRHANLLAKPVKERTRAEEKQDTLDQQTEQRIESIEEVAERFHRKAAETGENDPYNPQGKLYKQEQAAKNQKEQEAAKEAKRREKFIGYVKGQAKDLAKATTEKVGDAAYNVSQWSTPGGIGLLVILLLILAATVVIVNSQGDTRLKQCWYMLSGRAVLAGRVTPQTGGMLYKDAFMVDLGSLAQTVSTVIPSIPGVTSLPSGISGIPPIDLVRDFGQIGASLQQLGNSFRGTFGGLP